jgi:chromosome segregation ATPase
MTDLLRKLSAFEERLTRLAEQSAAAKARINELEAANEKLLQQNREQLTELKVFRKKQGNPTQSLSKSKEGSKLVKDNLAATVTNAELKQQLDEYIGIIDRLMAHLSNLS